MSQMKGTARVIRWTAGAVGLMTVGYASTVGVSWLRYGRPAAPRPEEIDPLLDRFMPEYDVAERHHVHVAAPAATTLAAAADVDFEQSTVIRGIFRARELVLGATPGAGSQPRGLLAQTTSLGWRALAEVPGREVVMGAVTQPWLPDVVFRGLPPETFRSFGEPDHVKIVWTLRADPVGARTSTFRTETRVMTTDAAARAKFRWYWARFSPGIVLIRYAMLRLLRAEAERRARQRPER